MPGIIYAHKAAAQRQQRQCTAWAHVNPHGGCAALSVACSRRPCALLQDALEQSKAKLVAVVQASMPQGTRHAWAQQLRLLGSSVGRPS